ncbi:MAG: hypothetical protein A2Y25_00305 [Candidatus Melainabacteria bacterium GWF2_37_15]|nr:MAG: hypothetical protein A2Y25_00305 [Candidatus Melainabacteria bacterium GWF2_37_15]
MIRKVWDKKTFRQVFYFLLIAVSIMLLWLIGQKLFNFETLFEAYELKTYDLRVGMATKHRTHNPNIVILAIDDPSLEILEEDLGRWPWPRDVYADAIEYMEQNGVDSIAFDLMFVGSQKGFEDKDLKLAQTIGKYDNVYVSMNFDVNEGAKSAPELPKKLSINLENNSKNINFAGDDANYVYCRLILDGIIKATDKIGFINFRRDPEDNISRRSPTFFKYQDNYYPYLALKLGADYIKRHENLDFNKFTITKDNKLTFGSRIFKLDDRGSMIIKWYKSQDKKVYKTYDYIPFWKVYKKTLPPDYFKDKIVWIGATAVSLYDIKSTPVSSLHPGVEVQATVLNNIIDNHSVKRVSPWVDLVISLVLSLLVALVVIKIREPIFSSLIAIFIILAYIFAASALLDHYMLWVGIVSQTTFIILTFTVMFIIKYVLKAKDFEYTYKLATTDGLTDLYNHRYFQEKLKESIKKADKNRSNFSIVLIDIDFFKKFNDTYGHQAGDEVLRQVGQVLKRSVKTNDMVARYGGEEMVIIVADADTNAAVLIADRICKTIAARKFNLGQGLEVNVTISLGVATYSLHGKTSTELIEFADKGLYRAKKNGRNQVGALESEEQQCTEQNA